VHTAGGIDHCRVDLQAMGANKRAFNFHEGSTQVSQEQTEAI
jgi:hypothetical protein